MVGFRETPVQIGAGARLSAVLTQPDRADTPAPVFVIPNAGLLHRVGPFRLHVQLARELARRGFPSLRLDLSGIGYSPRHPGLQGLDAAMADLDIAINWLDDTQGLNNPVLLGSCSGADLAHRVAVADERVRGCAMLDGYAYQNMPSALRYYATRVHRPSMWRKWLVTRLSGDGDADTDEEFWDSRYPPLDHFRSALAALIKRDLSLLFIYSGSVREYNYETQFFDLCPEARSGRVSVHYFADADHTYLHEKDRLALIDAICQWAETVMPAPVGA